VKTDLSPRLYFSYNQFMVYDQNVQLPGCAWTEEHSAQGFARRESSVCFNTLLEFGYADVAVCRSAYQSKGEYERVIAVPFAVVSGNVVVEGPDETEAGNGRSVQLPLGNYRLVAAQRMTGDEEEVIDLFFELLAKPLEQSSILLADEALNPPSPLIETAGIAGEE
jgi:hypothetical protein